MGLRRKNDSMDPYGIHGRASDGYRLPDMTERQGHRRGYHNYFQGYIEVRRENEKGRVVIERYYTQPWTVSGLSGGKYWLVRLLYALLTAASIVLYAVATAQNVPGNAHWVTALPGLPAAFLLFLLAVMTVQYITLPRKMTISIYKSGTKWLKVMSVLAAITQGATALALAGYALVTWVQVGRTLLCALGLLLAAGCSAVIYLIERRVPYNEVPNDTKVPEGEAYKV